MITILTDVMENFIELMEKAAVEFEIFNNWFWLKFIYFLLFSLSFEKERREKKKVTKKKREKENFIIIRL